MARDRPAPSPAAAASPPPAKRQRVSEAAVAELALEQAPPQYSVGWHWGGALGGSGAFSGGGGGGRARRPFASVLLAPAAVHDPAEAGALLATSGLGAGLRWALLPGAGGRPAAHPAAVHASADQAAGPEAGLRYFAQQAAPASAPASTPAAAHASAVSSSSAAAAGAWTRQYEQLLSQQPEDEQLWLAFAVRHAVEAGRGGGGGGAEALTPGARPSCPSRLLPGAHAPHACPLRRAWHAPAVARSPCPPLLLPTAASHATPLRFPSLHLLPPPAAPAAAVREAMLLVLKRGLERNRHSAALWPLYLRLYVQQPGGC